MALKNCPECNKEVSDKAKSCPSCGYPLLESDGNENEEEQSNKELNEEKNVIGNENNKIEEEKKDRLLEENTIKDKKTNENPKKSNVLLYFLVFISLLMSISNFLNLYMDDDNEDADINNTYVEESIQRNRESIAMNSLSLSASEGIITDKLVVQKALFFIWDDSSVHVSIDIRPQPIYSSKFLGGGEFDLTDRELRNALEEICENIIEETRGRIQLIRYDKQQEIKKIYITANNYEVGLYENGNIKLRGE